MRPTESLWGGALAAAVTTEEGEGGGASATGLLHYLTSDYPPLPPSLTGRKEVFFSGKTEPQKLQTEGCEAQKAGMREKGKALCQSLETSASFLTLHTASWHKIPRQESRGVALGETAWLIPPLPRKHLQVLSLEEYSKQDVSSQCNSKGAQKLCSGFRDIGDVLLLNRQS